VSSKAIYFCQIESTAQLKQVINIAEMLALNPINIVYYSPADTSPYKLVSWKFSTTGEIKH